MRAGHWDGAASFGWLTLPLLARLPPLSLYKKESAGQRQRGHTPHSPEQPLARETLLTHPHFGTGHHVKSLPARHLRLTVPTSSGGKKSARCFLTAKSLVSSIQMYLSFCFPSHLCLLASLEGNYGISVKKMMVTEIKPNEWNN